jgi:phosphoglycolate phosphatase-like HAD superfamily hydrolase
VIRAFVFDLDGTLIETEELKALSYARAATALRPDLNEGEVIAAFGNLVGLSRAPPDVALTSIYITSTSPGTQSTATRCKPEKRKRLR